MIICKDRGNFNFSAKNSEGRRSESTVEKEKRKKMNSGDGKREKKRVVIPPINLDSRRLSTSMKTKGKWGRSIGRSGDQQGIHRSELPKSCSVSRRRHHFEGKPKSIDYHISVTSVWNKLCQIAFIQIQRE